MKKELEALKSKIAVLEAKVKELESRQTIHNHYHTYPSPWTYQPIPINTWPSTQPYFGDPIYRITCGGSATGGYSQGVSTLTGRADSFAVN